MKGLTIFLAMTIAFLCTNAQVFEPNFLGRNYESYKGVAFRIQPNAVKEGFQYSMYSDLTSCATMANNILFPVSTDNNTTSVDSLLNRVFVVEEIIDTLHTIVFLLKDKLNAQRIFFRYDPATKEYFPFNTSAITKNYKKVCAEVRRVVDDFTQEVRLNTPVQSSMTMYKYITKSKVTYYLSLGTAGNTSVFDGKGVTVLFNDGTRWSRNEKIDIDLNGSGYGYTAFIHLTPADILAFSSKTIKKFRLYIFDEDVELEAANDFKTYVKCIKGAK